MRKTEAEGAAARRVIHHVRQCYTACGRFWPRLSSRHKITLSWKHVTCADCREAKR